MKDKHESYGMLDISRFSGGKGQFFGSDLVHQGGISISIHNANRKRDLSTDWIHAEDEIIRIELSHNQFVDAITSGMNTAGVPCTIKRFDGKGVPQIDHVIDRKEQFTNEMQETQGKYKKRIDGILELLEGNVGKRKAAEIKHELEILKSHIGSNDNFVLKCFNEAMDKTVTEAKHSVANYIDHKVHSFGIEAMRKELNISIENK
jgi:hypothetical protein